MSLKRPDSFFSSAKEVYLWVSFVLLISMLGLRAGSANDALRTLQESYFSAIEDAQMDLLQEQKRLAEMLKPRLDALEQEFMSAGDLDGILACRNVYHLYADGTSIEDAPEQVPSAVEELQKKMEASLASARAILANRLQDIQIGYRRQLMQLRSQIPAGDESDAAEIIDQIVRDLEESHRAAKAAELSGHRKVDVRMKTRSIVLQPGVFHAMKCGKDGESWSQVNPILQADPANPGAVKISCPPGVDSMRVSWNFFKSAHDGVSFEIKDGDFVGLAKTDGTDDFVGARLFDSRKPFSLVDLRIDHDELRFTQNGQRLRYDIPKVKGRKVSRREVVAELVQHASSRFFFYVKAGTPVFLRNAQAMKVDTPQP